MGVFSKMFGKYLLLTNTVSCGLMMAAGDMMQQHSDFLKKHMTKSIDNKAITTETSSPVLREEATFSKAIALLDDELADLQDVVQIVSKTEVDADKEGLDYVRIRNMTAVGLLQGPFHHYFYAALEKYLPGRATSAIFKKTVIDQTIASPTCLGIFFFGLGVMEHKNLQDINGEVKLKLFDTWKVDCMFWPPTQFINFLLVPVRYRVMYINFMTMIYDVFLSYMKYEAEFE